MRPSARGARSSVPGDVSFSAVKVSDERKPNDRLDASLGEAFGEFERAEQIVGVGERERRTGRRSPAPRASVIVSAPSSNE